MAKKILFSLLAIIVFCLISFKLYTPSPMANRHALPKPKLNSSMSVTQAIAQRHSTRSFSSEPITQQQLSQLLWAGQGITHDNKLRTTPSAGAKYPLELFIINSDSSFHYLADGHQLERLNAKPSREKIYQVALKQDWVKDAPLLIIIAADFDRTKQKYPEAAERFVWMEVGHCAQNIMLQATSMHLGIVGVGSFDADTMQKLLPTGEWTPLYILCIGNKLRSD